MTTTDGSAYYLKPPTFDEDLVRVGRGTPGGELLRRYWHPVAVASEVKDLPIAIRALGEDLILFRTTGGAFGLVHPRCCHRGTTLLYGRVEEQGIRCCYHGWLFGPEGHCLDQPCEPGGGEKRENYRQPWYPVQERYGLVFAYLGPPAKRPPLPRYDVLEEIPDGFELVADGNTIPSGGPPIMACNWFQTHENAMDPLHLPVLHKDQFPPAMTGGFADLGFEAHDAGVFGHSRMDLPGDTKMFFSAEVLLPNVRIIPDPLLGTFGPSNNVGWTLPIDDTQTRIFTVLKMPIGARYPSSREFATYGGKTWWELDAEGHQRFPGDNEAQTGQGVITFHSEERLAWSDRGVALWRKVFRKGMDAVARGEDPPLAFGAGEIVITVRAASEMVVGGA